MHNNFLMAFPEQSLNDAVIVVVRAQT